MYTALPFCTCPWGGGSHHLILKAGEFVDLYVPQKCSTSNQTVCAKDHTSIQLNVAKIDKVTVRGNGQFKTYAICGAICRMGESNDFIL